DRDRLLQGALREGHPRVARAPAEGEVLERALAALVADRAVERMVDEDEFERRLLTLGGSLGGLCGVDDHPLGRSQRAGGLQLRHALDLAEAHPAGPDGRAEPGLVAEDGNLDTGRKRRLDEPRPGSDLNLAPVDGDGDELRRAHVTLSCRRLTPGRSRWHLRYRGVGVLVDRREDPFQRRLAAERTGALIDVPLELLAEVAHVLDDRARGEVAEGA